MKKNRIFLNFFGTHPGVFLGCLCIFLLWPILINSADIPEGSNHPPTFTLGPDQETYEDSGLNQLSNFVSHINPGHPDETNQQLTFHLSNDNPDLFSVQPTVSPTGTLKYTPSPDINGVANVLIYLKDDGGTDNDGVDQSITKNFKITVLAVNDAPDFTKGEDQIIIKNAGLQVIPGWATRMTKGPEDEKNQQLEFIIDVDKEHLFKQLPQITPDGVLSYEPDRDAYGQASVSVILKDDGGNDHFGVDTSVPKIFTISIRWSNHAPSFSKGPDISVLEDVDFQTFEQWATNIQSGPIEESFQNVFFYVSVDQPELFTIQPAIASNGTLTFRPEPDANGKAMINVFIKDDGGTDFGGVDQSQTQTFYIEIKPVNDAPSFTPGADQSTSQNSGTQLITAWAKNISKGPADEADQKLKFFVTADKPALFTPPPEILANGTLRYTPAENAYGNALITVYLMDNGGTYDNGDDTSENIQFNITILAVNHAPFFTPGDDIIIPEDSSFIEYENWATEISAGSPEESYQTLTFNVYANPPTLFRQQPKISSDGTLSFETAPDANGQAKIRIFLKDDGGIENGGVDQSEDYELKITITPVNDAPRPVSDTININEDEPTLYTLTAIDIENDPIQFELFLLPQKGEIIIEDPASGRCIYKPYTDTVGIDHFSFQALDDHMAESEPAEVTVIILSINDAPQISEVNDQITIEDIPTQPIDIYISDTDSSFDQLSLVITSSNQMLVPDENISVQGSAGHRTFILTPVLNQHGSSIITLRITDDIGLFDEVQFEFIVQKRNDPPTISTIDDQMIYEDQTTPPISFSINDSETPVANLEIQVIPSDTNIIPLENIKLFGVDVMRTMTLKPISNASGEIMITVTVFDAEMESDSQTFILEILPINDPPSLSTIDPQTIIEDNSSPLIAFSVNDPDSMPENISVKAKSGNPLLIPDDQIVISGLGQDRTVQITPAPNQSGSVRIDLIANDGAFDSETMSFIVNITPVNDPPTAEAGEEQSVGEGRTVYLDASASEDPENKIIFYQWKQISGATVYINDSTKAEAYFTAPQVGPNGTTLVFEILIIDHENIESKDTVQITVKDMAGQYMIQAISGENGAIFPSGQLFVQEYSSKTFSIAANTNYEIKDVLINGTSIGPVDNYTFENISQDMTIHAFFMGMPKITAQVDGNGQISPSGTIVVDRGTRIEFTITPDPGNKIDYLLVNGTVMSPKTNFYFWDVQLDQEITAVFIPDSIYVESEPGKRGKIEPSGKIPVAPGSNLTLYITPDDGYQIDDVQVNGTSIGKVSKHTLYNILANTNIYAQFRPVIAQTIIASSGENGSISPEGDTKVASGMAQNFRMIPDNDYQVADVLIDNQSIGPVSHYTFPSVERNYQIHVTFIHKPKITTFAGPNGYIEPEGDIYVEKGWYQEFFIAADDNYEVKDVLVNGESIGSASGFIFLEVNEDLSIQAEFEAMPVIRALSDTNGKIIPSGTIVVPKNSFQQFRLIPQEGYKIDKLNVNGINQSLSDNQSVFTLAGVTKDYTINVNYKLDQYTLSATSGENGSISPTGNKTIFGRETLTYIFTPEPGYEVSKVIVDSNNVGRLLTYTFDTIISDHSIYVDFIKKPIITAQSGDHGDIYPKGSVEIHNGDFQMFLIKPDTGFKVESILVDDEVVSVPVDQINAQNLWKSYVFSNIEQDHNISVTFNRCHIQTATNGNGRIEPDGELVFDVHDHVSFSFTPNSGFVVDDVIVDNESIGPQYYYNFWKLTDDHSLEVNFRAIEVHTLTATATTGGSITPSGVIKVLDGEYGEFMIEPDENHELTDVLANGKSILEITGDDVSMLPVGKDGYFISLDISSDQNIKAVFTEIPEYEIMAISGDGGKIEPSGFIKIRHGQYQLFTFSPNPGYAVKDVQVDNVSMGSLNSYSFSVMDNHRLIVSFTPINTRMIKGTVVDKEAPLHGLENFLVEVWKGDSLIQTTTTNINGEYEIENLPATDQLVMAAWPPLGTADYYGRFYNDKKDRRDADPLSTLTGNLEDIRFMMQRTFEEGIRGQVREGNVGIAHIMVDVFEDSATFVKNVMTDENGFYTLTGLDPTEDYKVSVWYRPYATEYFYSLPDFNKPGDIPPTYSVLSWDRARLLRSQYPPLTNIDIIIDPGASIRGTVLLPDNSPAQGIRVNAHNDIDNTGNGALTDAFGRYTITGLKPVAQEDADTGGYYVEIQPVDYPYMAYPQATHLSQAVRIATGRTDIDFQLKKGHHIYGTIHNEEGVPLENVQVSAWSLDDSDTKNGSTVTNSNGSYSILNLPIASDYIVSAMAEQYPINYYPNSYQIDTATSVDLLTHSATGVDLTLSKGSVIKGQVFVRQEFGSINTISGIWVNVWSESTQTGGDIVTNNEGQYEITGLAQNATDYKISIIHPDYQPAFYNETQDDDPYNDTVYQWDQAGNISPTNEFLAVDRNLFMDKGVSFSGRVTFENKPIAGVTVELFSDEIGGWGSVVSNDRTDTNFITTGLIPGIYTIRTYSDNYADTWITDINLNESIMDFNIQLQAPDRRISGTVVGLQKGEIVRINAWSNSANCNSFVEITGSGFSSNFAIQGLKPASDYILETYSKNYPRQVYDGRSLLQTADRVDISVHDASGIVFRFERKGSFTISGQVIFPDDTINGTSVRIEARSELTDTLIETTLTWSDTNTENTLPYTLTGNGPSDDYQLRVVSDQFIDLFYPQSISLSDAQTINTLLNNHVKNIDFTLMRGSSISGKVTDSQNIGIAGLDIIAWSDELETGSQTQTTSDGSFTVLGLAEASDYRIEIVDPYLGRFYYNVDQAVRERLKSSLINTQLGDIPDITLQIDSFESIKGHVTDTQGKRLSGVWIDAWSVSMQAGNGVFTDDDGNYEIPGLPKANDYQLNVLPQHLYLPDQKNNITAPCDALDFRLQSISGYRIRGTVSGSNQNPVQLARVEIQSISQEHAYGWTMTLADGSYEIDHLPKGNDYIITVLPPFGVEDAFKRLTGISITADRALDIQLNPELLFSGILTDQSTQKAVPDASVVVFSASTGYWNETISNKDGLYKAHHVPAGDDYMVIVNAPDYLESKKTNLTPGINIDFSLETGGVISGVVKLASTGKGMPDVPVEVYSVSNAGLSDFGGIATTDANGQYRISQLKITDHKGYDITDYTVFIYPDGYPPQSRGNKATGKTVDFVVAGGESNQTIGTVKMPENSSVIVDVFENDSDFVTCAQVSDSGNFIVEGLHANKKYQYRFISVIQDIAEPLIQWAGESQVGVDDRENAVEYGVPSVLYFEFQTDVRKRSNNNVPENIFKTDLPITNMSIFSGGPGPVQHLRSSTHAFQLLKTRKRGAVTTSGPDSVSNDPTVSVAWDPPSTGSDSLAGYYGLFTSESSLALNKFNTVEKPPIRTRKITSRDLEGDDVSYYFHVAAVDKQGRIGTTTSIAFRIDTVPPTNVSVVAPDTTSQRNIQLLLGAGGASEMYISNDSYQAGGSWEKLSQKREWQLTSNNGDKPVYVRFRDKAGNLSQVMARTVYTKALPQYTIQLTAGDYGEISPSGTLYMEKGENLNVTILPDSNYRISRLTVDGKAMSSNTTEYVFQDINADHRLAVTFEKALFKIVTGSGDNGSIGPNGEVMVEKGQSQAFNITPETGYAVEQFLLDMTPIEWTGSPFMLTNITEGHQIFVTFTRSHTLNAQAEENGQVIPFGTFVIAEGNHQPFEIKPDKGYAIDEVLLDNEPVEINNNALTLYNIQQTHDIKITFKKVFYTIQSMSGVNGIIQPEGNISLQKNSQEAFQILADDGYILDQLHIDGISITSENISNYTFTDITSDHTIAATFKPKKFIIQANAGSHGSVQPSGDIAVNWGDQTIFIVEPASGYSVDQVILDGQPVKLTAGYYYTLKNILANHIFSVSFKRVYQIAAISGTNGQISPSGMILVEKNNDQSFELIPDHGFEFAGLQIDDTNIVVENLTYTFSNVISDHQLIASYQSIPIQITATSGINGVISPSGLITYNMGSPATFLLKADPGYEVAALTIDGVSMPYTANRYIFESVDSPHKIDVSFQVFNYAPTVSDAAFSLNEDTSVCGNLKANDEDGDLLTYEIVSPPEYGQTEITNSTDGLFCYTPNKDVFGADQFTFKVNDSGKSSNIGTVTVNIKAQNDEPVALDDHWIVVEDSLFTTQLKANDVDNEPLTYTLLENNEPGLAVLIDASTGDIKYQPGLNQNGEDSLKFLVSDGTFVSEIAEVTILIQAINDPPVAHPETLETGRGQAIMLTLTASDVENDALQYNITALPKHGTLTVVNMPVVEYLPNKDFIGTDSFEFSVQDNTDMSNTAVISIVIGSINTITQEEVPVTLNVKAGANIIENPINGTIEWIDDQLLYTPSVDYSGYDTLKYQNSNDTVIREIVIKIEAINDAPVIEPMPSVFVLEDQMKAITIIATDPDADPLTYSSTQTQHGTIIGTGPVYHYYPDSNYHGTDLFMVTVSDGIVSRNIQVHITVTAQNDPPILSQIQTIDVLEDSFVELTINATDHDQDSLILQIIDNPEHGILQGISLDMMNLTYTPEANFEGWDYFTCKAFDGTIGSEPIQISIKVLGINDPPIANGYHVNGYENTNIFGQLSGSDIENQKLLYEVITQAVNGLVSITPTTGEFLYRPSKDFIGNDHFAFSVSDGYTRSVPVTVTIIVSKGNRPPVGESGLLSLQEDSPVFYTLTATDSNQDTLTFQIVDQGTLGQVQLLDASTGRCEYIPHLNKNGTDMFTFIANDSKLDSDITTITVQISPINDPPVGSISTLTTDEDFEKLGTLHASDVEGDSLIFSIENQGSKGNVTLVNPQTGTYRYNPYANQNGTDSFQFTVSDGQNVSLPVAVDVIIQAQNDKPVASSLTFQTIEDTAISNMLKASDIDGDALSFIQVDEPDALSKGILEITDAQSGAFTYYPPSNKFGSFVIEYYVTDGKARSENVSLTIQVLPANDAPIVFNQNLYTELDTELLITLSGYDIDQDPLIFETSTSPRHGQLIKEGENYLYTPETGFQGIDVFTYQSNDQSGTESALSNIGIVSIRVGVPLADIYTQEDNPVSIDLLAGTDFSAEDVTDYQVIAQPSHGLIMGTGQARSFLPDSDYYGLDSFTYIFTVASKQYTGEISIYIIPVNDPPRIKGIIPYPALTYEDQPLTLTLSISDQDTPLSSLNISLLQSPSHGQLSISGQKLYYKPSQNYSGTDQVIVSVSDGFAGSSSSQVIDIQVAPSNDAPIAFEQELETLEETQINILPQAVDQESDPLVYEIVQGPLNGQLLGQSPSFTYVPNQNFFGTDSFTFVANDGVLKSKETLISINVKNKNDPPKANSGSFKSSNGNSIEGRLSAFDMDGDILIYSLIQQPQKGLFVLINPVIGTFVYYPHTEASGIDSFSYKVFDGTSDSNTALVNITIESDATQNQFTDLRIKLLPPYKNLDDYTYMFIEADTGQMVLTGSHVIDTVDVILLKGNYRLVIIAPNYLPYEYENESNQKYFELIENQQELNVELVQKQSFNPKPPGVDVSYMVTPYGIKLWAVKKNIIEGDQFYMHIQTASGEIPVDSQEITGDGTANAPYTYQWTQSSPWTNFTGQTYEVEFIFYGGVYGHAEKIDQISISWQRNQLNRQRSVSDNDTNAFTHEFGNSPLYISQGNSEFYPLVGTVCHATLMDNQGIERHMSINIPPIPLEYLYIDNADISGGQLNYNSETDQFQLSQELTIVQPDDKLYISINYYTFGTANAGNGVSLSFYMVEGPFAGKAVRYNPILGDNSSRMENAPLIALPIYLNPNSELLSDISDLSKVELEILVNERGDGEHGFRSETLSTTIEDDGLVFVEINHLTLVGLDVIIESPAPTPSGSGDSGGSGCFIDNISNTLQYSRWHEIIGFVFICVLVGLILRIKKMAR